MRYIGKHKYTRYKSPYNRINRIVKVQYMHIPRIYIYVPLKIGGRKTRENYISFKSLINILYKILI